MRNWNVTLALKTWPPALGLVLALALALAPGFSMAAPQADAEDTSASASASAAAPADYSETFYVSTTGSDSDAGTEDAPWKTIQYAASHLTAGQRVYVKKGTYSGATNSSGTIDPIAIGVSGASGKPIAFQAYPGDEQEVVVKGGFSATKQSHLVLGGFTVQNAHYGFHITGPATDITVQDNHTYNTHGSGVFVEGVAYEAGSSDDPPNSDPAKCSTPWECLTYLTVTGNTIEGFAGDQERISIGNGVRHVTVKNNEVFGTSTDDVDGGGEGIDLKQGVRDATVCDNHLHDHKRQSIYVEAGRQSYTAGTPVNQTILICRNRVARSAGGINITTEGVGRTEDVRVVDNVVVDTDYDGISVYNHPEGTGTLNHIWFVNNTVYKVHRYGLVVSHWLATNVLVRNNIAYASGSADYVFDQYGDGFVHDHNMVDGTDPLFVCPAGWDLHLKAGSPAVDAGSATNAATGDFDQVSRPQGAGVDIGAYER